MTWAALIEVIIKFLGPVLVEWLKHLLERIEPTAVPGDPETLREDVAVAAVFAEARKGLPWWSFGRRGLLRACERVCVRRAGQLAGAARGGPLPGLTVAEMVEVAKAAR